MFIKVLNRRQARWAELLANYDFVLVLISSTKNPADGPLHHPDYLQNISVLTGSLIPPNAHHLLPSNFTNSTGTTTVNTLFASIIEVHSVKALKTTT